MTLTLQEKCDILEARLDYLEDRVHWLVEAMAEFEKKL